MENKLRRAKDAPARLAAEIAKAESDLRSAEAGLAGAILDQCGPGADRVGTNAAVDRARAYCRQSYTALTRLKLQETGYASGERARMPIEEPAEQALRAPAGPTPSRRSGEMPAVGAPRPPRKQSRLERSYHQLIRGSQAEEPRARAAPDWRPLTRRSFMLLALVLAYLQYYFLDVNLQIARLPSVAVVVFSPKPHSR